LLNICSSDVELVTSKHMLDELLRATGVEQRALLVLLATLAAKVPYHQIGYGTPGYLGGTYLGGAPLGGGGPIVDDPLLADLKTIFDPDDAIHIFQAVQSRCDLFLTLDVRTVINRVTNNQQRVAQLCPGLRFGDPHAVEAFL
jgi:hypothetical protein